jgi:porphobilinogen synthase|tara:strand:+ start:3056 stop:4030 length:975 start_codon:yes stop_codon:yes gene_type:complete
MFPYNRPRRLRSSETLRNLIKETTISPSDFLVPLFIISGENKIEEISSMPNYFKRSIDLTLKQIESLRKIGLNSFLLFAQIDDKLKDNYGKEAINKDGLMQRGIREIKNKFPDVLLMTDVALDPYSIHGHDGVVENSKIINDITIEILSNMSLSHVKAGADFVAPSDMMDGRIKIIRETFESNGFHNAGIMSYSAKYASCFYGPFRDALNSTPGFGDKKEYQMDFSNRSEAVREVNLDIKEGADIVMVKPGISYLDIIRDLKNNCNIPISSYQVSGEYAMIKLAAKQGWIDEDQAILETSIAFKRAGASFIASYFAEQAVKLIS